MMGGVLGCTAASTTKAYRARPTNSPRNTWLVRRRTNWSNTTGERLEAVCWTARSSTENVIDVTVTSPVATAPSVEVAVCFPIRCPRAPRTAARPGPWAWSP